MSDEQINKLALKLGYERVDFLPSVSTSSAVSLHAFTNSGVEHVVKLWKASSSSSQRSGLQQGLYGTSTYQTYLYSTGSTDSPVENSDAKLLANSALRWEIGEKSDGSASNRILSYGLVTGYLFECREYCPMTLMDLIERQVRPNHQTLGQIVDQLWGILGFLHSANINTPHGALHPRNVGITSKSLTEAKFVLLDIAETSETRRFEFKRKDYQSLGILIYRLCNSLLDEVEAVDVMVRCKNATWPHLGKHEAKWKAVVQHLLDAPSMPTDWNADGARLQQMAELLGGGVQRVSFQPSRLDLSKPPYFEFLDEQQTTTQQQSFAAKAAEAWLSGNFVLAFHALNDCPQGHGEKEHCLKLADQYAALLKDDSAVSTDLLMCFEALARAGSTQCMFLLGRLLAKTEPVEAIDWLAQAASRGIVEAKALIAGILESGSGDAMKPDPIKASELYHEFLQESGTRDAHILYRLAALMLREPDLAHELPKAIRLLEEAHDGGHFQSTDLLAQCYAQGYGAELNEKKAFQLFADAWNRSKKANQEYYTASNNLGVCFAIGFGVKKGITMARHYFRQGEQAGHEASKKNLLSLAQLG